MNIGEFMTSLFSQCNSKKITLVSVPSHIHQELLKIIPHLQQCGLQVDITDNLIQSKSPSQIVLKNIHIWAYPEKVNLEELNKLVVMLN